MRCNYAAMALVVILCSAASHSYAQSAAVVGGGDAKGPTGTSSFTIGQAAIGASTATPGSVSEGIQQPYTIKVIAGEGEPNIDVTITAYPNPATTVVNVKITRDDRETFSCQLLDVGGRLVARQDVKDVVTTLPLNERASGAYTVQVMQGNNIVKSFNIIKKQ